MTAEIEDCDRENTGLCVCVCEYQVFTLQKCAQSLSELSVASRVVSTAQINLFMGQDARDTREYTRCHLASYSMSVFTTFPGSRMCPHPWLRAGANWTD